ncbi:MAG: hypothetical protein GY822_05030 [Deltaproteobacteria bacterium]|nr:hypothetical protein [Deltaproteobacteria bacterium]
MCSWRHKRPLEFLDRKCRPRSLHPNDIEPGRSQPVVLGFQRLVTSSSLRQLLLSNRHLVTSSNLHPVTSLNLHPVTSSNLHPVTSSNLHP